MTLFYIEFNRGIFNKLLLFIKNKVKIDDILVIKVIDTVYIELFDLMNTHKCLISHVCNFTADELTKVTNIIIVNEHGKVSTSACGIFDSDISYVNLNKIDTICNNCELIEEISQDLKTSVTLEYARKYLFKFQ